MFECRWAEALQAYKTSLLYIKQSVPSQCLPGIDPKQVQKHKTAVVQLSQTCLLNEATVNIKLRNGKDAFDACSVVSVSPSIMRQQCCMCVHSLCLQSYQCLQHVT